MEAPVVVIVRAVLDCGGMLGLGIHELLLMSALLLLE